MSLAKIDKVYCSNCKKGLHNKYIYLGEGRVKVEATRCKGEVQKEYSGRKTSIVTKCECDCQTHFIHNGFKVKIGNIPPSILEPTPEAKRKSKALDRLVREANDMMEKKREDSKVNFKPNRLLGTMGAEEEEVVTTQDNPTANEGYATRDKL